MLKKLLMSVAIFAVATSAIAQTPKPAAKAKVSKPAITQASNDTLGMTCAAAISAVKSKPEGVVLKTGANRWDLYIHDGEACLKSGGHDNSPAFVRTKDNKACHIGYTCEDLSDSDGE
jgi:hypothetical protein